MKRILATAGLAAATLSLALSPAFSAAQADSAKPAAETKLAPKPTRIQAWEIPMVMLPTEATQLPAVGVPFMVKDEKPLFEIPLGWQFAAQLDGDLILEYQKEKVTIPAGTVLPASWAEGGDLPPVRGKTQIFCADPRSNVVQEAFSILTLGITDLFTTKSNDMRFCVIDDTGDGSFDHGFLEGMKDPTLNKKFQLNGETYQKKNLQKHHNGQISLNFKNGGLLLGPKLAIQISGDAYDLWDVDSVRTLGRFGIGTVYSGRYGIDRKKLPQTYNVLGVRFKVLEFDKKNAQVKVQIEHYPSTTAIQPTFWVNRYG